MVVVDRATIFYLFRTGQVRHSLVCDHFIKVREGERYVQLPRYTGRNAVLEVLYRIFSPKRDQRYRCTRLPVDGARAAFGNQSVFRGENTRAVAEECNILTLSEKNHGSHTIWQHSQGTTSVYKVSQNSYDVGSKFEVFELSRLYTQAKPSFQS